MSARRAWSAEDKTRFAAMYRAGDSERSMLAAFPGRTRNALAGRAVHLQLHRPPRPERVRGLPPDNAAALAARTIFPSRVRDPAAAPAVLVTGAWQRKLGPLVTKGAFRGFPIYSLTLEERATCPAGCQHWLTCMGNGMQAAWRHRHGDELERQLYAELVQLQARHPGGFLVRLHILGDFYSEAYVERWAGWLDEFPALHVFGYTAWPRSTPIGAAVFGLSCERWARFAVRLSAVEPGPGRAVTLWKWGEGARQGAAQAGIIVCPVETGQSRDCGSCGLCWSAAARDKAIGFIAHGPAWLGRTAA